mmetsp:Transcript_47183/g.109110  ORF Transcript_47183/g.109110 Transcript_47183/m.109110 type:complete len:238 (+) Transcript_47183:273-986(+)
MTKLSLGQGVDGSWQYNSMHFRESPSEAGLPSKPGHWQLGYLSKRLHMSSQSGPNAVSFAWRNARCNLSCVSQEPAMAIGFALTALLPKLREAPMRWSNASHCNTETFVFSLTHMTKLSLGQGVDGSWQYLSMHLRESSSEAALPAKPGHWQFGYWPVRWHISSHTTPKATNLAWSMTRCASSRAKQLDWFTLEPWLARTASTATGSQLATMADVTSENCIAMGGGGKGTFRPQLES